MNSLWIVECDGETFVVVAVRRDEAIRLCEESFGPAKRTLSARKATGSIGVDYELRAKEA